MHVTLSNMSLTEEPPNRVALIPCLMLPSAMIFPLFLVERFVLADAADADTTADAVSVRYQHRR